MGGVANCGFDDDSAQSRSVARTMVVLTTTQRNSNWGLGQSWFRRRFSISRGQIFIFMYSRQLWCCRWLGDISMRGNAHLFHLCQGWVEWVSELIVICILLVYAKFSILKWSTSGGLGGSVPYYTLNIMLTYIPPQLPSYLGIGDRQTNICTFNNVSYNNASTGYFTPAL